MICTQATGADSAFPLVDVIQKLSVVSQCSKCYGIKGEDRQGVYEGVLLCDECADLLKPERYNAELTEILSVADLTCLREIGFPLKQVVKSGFVALIEDDMGDLAYMSCNQRSLFGGEIAELGGSTSDYLPTEIRLQHRKIHREAIMSQVNRDCIQTAAGKHWICKILPFLAAAEAFTLSLFQMVA